MISFNIYYSFFINFCHDAYCRLSAQKSQVMVLIFVQFSEQIKITFPN